MQQSDKDNSVCMLFGIGHQARISMQKTVFWTLSARIVNNSLFVSPSVRPPAGSPMYTAYIHAPSASFILEDAVEDNSACWPVNHISSCFMHVDQQDLSGAGKGSEIGDFLTQHPAVNCISFTGGDTGISVSKKVSLTQSI